MVTRLTYLLAVIAAAVILPCQSASADLIAHYKFDGDTTDATGEDFNEGFEDGDAFPTGEPGFDGTGEAYGFEGQGHVIVPIDLGPEEYPDLTVTMWVKPDESIIDSPGLYKTFGHDDGGWDRTFGLDSRNGEFRYAAFTGGAGPEPTETTGVPITSDWTFLGAVWDTDEDDDTVGTITFYVNQEVVSEPLNNTSSAHLEAAIGNLRPDNFNEGWVGLIDDVRIFDTALGSEEIDEIRNVFAPDVVGDADGNGIVDLDDYLLIQANAFTPDLLGDPALGDVNSDQFVDFEDFRIWKEAFPGGVAAAEAAIATVPEPSSIGIALGLIALCSLARSRRSNG
jgi:hypothetical protein